LLNEQYAFISGELENKTIIYEEYKDLETQLEDAAFDVYKKHIASLKEYDIKEPKSEIEKLLGLSYEECCEFFKNKYGLVPKKFFVNETCRSKTQGNARGKDGLYIHHIDEDKAILLSTPEVAARNPFEYQQADHLVYVNLLEHLLLHVKIVEKTNSYNALMDTIKTNEELKNDKDLQKNIEEIYFSFLGKYILLFQAAPRYGVISEDLMNEFTKKY
jgi:hypothetical protein